MVVEIEIILNGQERRILRMLPIRRRRLWRECLKFAPGLLDGDTLPEPFLRLNSLGLVRLDYSSDAMEATGLGKKVLAAIG